MFSIPPRTPEPRKSDNRQGFADNEGDAGMNEPIYRPHLNRGLDCDFEREVREECAYVQSLKEAGEKLRQYNVEPPKKKRKKRR